CSLRRCERTPAPGDQLVPPRPPDQHVTDLGGDPRGQLSIGAWIASIPGTEEQFLGLRGSSGVEGEASLHVAPARTITDRTDLIGERQGCRDVAADEEAVDALEQT